MYSKKVMDHFNNPRNQGRIVDADGVGKVGNPVCGDVLYFYLKIREGVIEDIKWETYGCAAAISVSSMLSEMVKGKSVKEALEIKSSDVIKELGDLPPVKTHCSLLGVEALQEALYDYLSRGKGKIPEELERAHRHNLKTLNSLHK